jgi:hypothetical protein
MRKQKGLVLKKEDNNYLILTPDGEFKNISLFQEAQVGEKISFSPGVTGVTRMLLLAASICLLIFGWLAFQATFAPAVAYVSLDFNPSLELGIDQEKKIVSVTPLDQSTKKLLQNEKIKSQTIEEGIKIILEKAQAKGYLQGSPQIILAAYAPVKTALLPIITIQEVAQIIDQTLKEKTEAKVIVAAATPVNHQKAKKSGLSLGKYLFAEAAEKEGKITSVQELKEEKLNEIETRHNISIEEVFLKQAESKKTIIILPLPSEKIKPGQQLPKPATSMDLKNKENNLKKIGLPEQKQLPQKQQEEKLPVLRQEQTKPGNKIDQNNREGASGKATRNLTEFPEKKTEQVKNASEIIIPELPRPEAPKVTWPEKPESRETIKPDPEKTIQPSLPVAPSEPIEKKNNEGVAPSDNTEVQNDQKT